MCEKNVQLDPAERLMFLLLVYSARYRQSDFPVAGVQLQEYVDDKMDDKMRDIAYIRRIGFIFGV
jgi:hypothetical protein